MKEQQNLLFLMKTFFFFPKIVIIWEQLDICTNTSVIKPQFYVKGPKIFVKF